MRRVANKLGVLLIFWGLLTLYACGSGGGDILNEMGQRYTSSLVIQDNGDETLDIDVVQDMCDTDPEPFTNVFGVLTVAVPSGSAGLTLVSYTIQYVPLASADGSGATVMPPELVSPGEGYAHFDIAAGGSADLTFTCMSIDTKEEYVNFVPATLGYGRYAIVFTFHFRSTVGEDVDITVDRTVYLGEYDNC